jgi:hypothetical protein
MISVRGLLLLLRSIITSPNKLDSPNERGQQECKQEIRDGVDHCILKKKDRELMVYNIHTSFKSRILTEVSRL